MVSHVDRIVETTVLSDRTGDLLMVSGSVDGGNAVDTGWKTVGNGDSQNAVAVRDGIDTLEEGEDLRIQGLSRVERLHLLYGNMTVSLNDTIDQLLRGSEVSACCIYKRSGIQVVDFESDVELGVGRNGTKVRGGLELGCWLQTAH
jgi:hypothetical protein